MNDKLMKKTLECDLCVIGGGLSGSFAALAAARHGAKVILMQDRPMLGGNASSEIRMWVRGAAKDCGKLARETGLISELEERNIYYNPTLVSTSFDATLYGLVNENENVQLLMNTSCMDAEMDGNKIVSVTGWQMTTYTMITVKAKLFMDCSGDSILAPLTGAEYRVGREAKSEFGEELAKDVADRRTMGMSVLLAARETDHPVKFTPPPFANIYPTDECFTGEMGRAHELGREHNIETSGGNLWWVELGGEMDSIHDADRVREELLACIYGVWDHIKNQGDHGKENWDLEWVGFLPGKRESRRYVGDLIMTEHDLVSGGRFEDEVAYGGWPIDDHNPYGMRRNAEEQVASISTPVKEPYGISLRTLHSKNIDNLMFAGRNISVSHVALSSTRVMATCSLIGQAAGTAAATSLKYGITPRETANKHYAEVQRQLMDDGVFLPHVLRKTNEKLVGAKFNVSDAEKALLLNGRDRPVSEAEEGGVWQNVGDSLCMNFGKKEKLGTLRLVMDPDFSRMTISQNFKMRMFCQKLHTGKDFVPVTVANTIVKSFEVYADGKLVWSTDDNFRSFVKIPLNLEASEICVKWLETRGAEKVHLFSVDLLD